MAVKKVPAKLTVARLSREDNFCADLCAALFRSVKLKLSIQLVSATVHGSDGRGLRAPAAEYEVGGLAEGETEHELTLHWGDEAEHGEPGAIIVRNKSKFPVLVKTVTVNGEHSFVCNGWVYPTDRHPYRLFFINKAYTKESTPPTLLPYREEELKILRGELGTTKLPFQRWDRVYDYAFYNDLGDPDTDPSWRRPVLGGSSDFPYPRRCKTGRPPSKSDPHSESRIPISKELYIPCDEWVERIKPKANPSSVLSGQFKTFDEIFSHYTTQGADYTPPLDELILLEAFKDLLSAEVTDIKKFPIPDVVKAERWAWQTDEEFAREMIAGMNPVVITPLREFPPKSNLDHSVFGNQDSRITHADVESNLDGLSVEQALDEKRLFILDYHDALMPYLERINQVPDRAIYATRTVLFLQNDSTLKPLAIELSLPHPQGQLHGAVSKVYTPPAPEQGTTGVERSLWNLAKVYVAANDTGVHQLISHFLHTHASAEPYIIAANRQLSALHPIYKLLFPHFRNTMNINALARQLLINAGEMNLGLKVPGIIEHTQFPGKYSMEMSSQIYKGWKFPEQALPVELIKRGMTEGDPHNVEELKRNLVIKDYPYAVDGLDIWTAIKNWVTDYCSIYYHNDHAVEHDSELQAWWKEVREEGHGDKKGEPWWPKMHSRSDLIEACTIIIWTASALHAAVNFGQYGYGGFPVNRPGFTCKFMPEPGTPEYSELASNPDSVLLATVSPKQQALVVMSTLLILSTHSKEEVYLGQRSTPEWTNDEAALRAFAKFEAAVQAVERTIESRNKNPHLRNRHGPVQVPYTLLMPTSAPGATGRGIPNSISI